MSRKRQLATEVLEARALLSAGGRNPHSAVIAAAEVHHSAKAHGSPPATVMGSAIAVAIPAHPGPDDLIAEIDFLSATGTVSPFGHVTSPAAVAQQNVLDYYDSDQANGTITANGTIYFAKFGVHMPPSLNLLTTIPVSPSASTVVFDQAESRHDMTTHGGGLTYGVADRDGTAVLTFPQGPPRVGGPAVPYRLALKLDHMPRKYEDFG